MRPVHALRIVLTFIIVTVAAANLAASFFFSSELPVGVALGADGAMTVTARLLLPLPSPLRDRDRIDVASMDLDARAALGIAAHLGRVPVGKVYTLPVIRDGAILQAPIAAQPVPRHLMIMSFDSAVGFTWTLLAVISLLLIWRGRSPAAWGMALWSAGYVLGVANRDVHLDGTAGVMLQTICIVFYTLARAGFYLMADALVARHLAPRTRLLFRLGFWTLLLIGGGTHLAGLLLFCLAGSTTMLAPAYSLVFSWIYLIPFAMLLTGYRTADTTERARLRWVLASTLAITVSVTFTNLMPDGLLSNWIQISGFFVAATGIAYALLRHRVVDVSIVVDRALVYGAVTALVVGIVAAMNSLALKLALPPGAGWLLQVIVPLSLGITLGRVRRVLDQVVEQVFFRRKYQAEKALQTFARHAGHIQDAPKLLDASVREIARHLGAPAVAIYSAENNGYRRMKQAGRTRFPELLDADDAALVALRADQEAVDLARFKSELGDDGYVFPMMVLGKLRGFIVCRNRPHERYASDERKLLTEVAWDVGAAWRILRARDNEDLVVALAEGALPVKTLKEKAKALTLAWEV
ncbi:MAG TPA: hypothetical protein VGN70_03965 [Gammaproteobacteria bacterium]